MTHIKSIRVNEHTKIARLASAGQKSEIILPRFAPVSANDDIHVSGVTNKKIWITDSEPPHHAIPIVPTYFHHEKITIGARRLDIQFTEIDSPEKHKAYLDLERFHYRSNPSLIQQEETCESTAGGRKAVVLASIVLGQRREYLGYIELSMPLMMVAPRHRAFNRPFKHSTRDIAWSEWNQSILRKYLNLIVRISRVVTHPTFRGIGLARKLLLAAEQFAKERWHIQRRRPLFIEISAEMLNYFDFVSGSGYTYCGQTDGNQKRIARDMRSMSKGQKITSGIMTLQNKYFAVVEAFALSRNCSINDAISEIEHIALSDSPESCVSDQEWLLLRKLFRVPRPYYLKGLDEDAERYLRGVVHSPNLPSFFSEAYNPTIEICNLKVSAGVTLPVSKNVKVIKDAFGLVGDEVKQVLLVISKFHAARGNIFLLAGASGSGKSVFLDVLAMAESPVHSNIAVSYDKFNMPRPAKLSNINPDSIIIDYFADRYGLSRSIKTLATVGLSEALPMVKPFWMLSKGQKYRALIADLILSKRAVWLLDEFGADLDPITAAVMAAKLRSLADKLGVIIFLAAANNGHFYDALRPTRVINFDLGLEPRILKTQEYADEFFEKVE